MSTAHLTRQICFLGLLLGLSPAWSTAQSFKVEAEGGFLGLIPGRSDGKQDLCTRPIRQGGYELYRQTHYLALALKYTPRFSHVTLIADFTLAPLRGEGRYLSSDGGANTEGTLSVVSLGIQWTILQGPLRPSVGFRLAEGGGEVRKRDWEKYHDDIEFPRYLGGLGCSVLAGLELDLAPRVALNLTGRYNVTDLINEYSPDCNTFSVGLGVAYEVLP